MREGQTLQQMLLGKLDSHMQKTETRLPSSVQFSSVTQSCPTLCDPMDCSTLQTPLFMGFPRQEYWNGLPCPSPGDLPNPGIEPESSASPVLQVDSFPLSHQGSPNRQHTGTQRNGTEGWGILNLLWEQGVIRA